MATLDFSNLDDDLIPSAATSATASLTTTAPQCPCCVHPQRYLLERRFARELATQPKTAEPGEATAISPEFIDDLAMEFGISPDELIHHAEFHMSVKPGQGSLETKVNLEEATILTDALYDGMATLAHVGAVIRNQEPTALMRVLTKEIVDLYVGTHKALQDHVNTLARLDAQVNGTRDQSSASLDALTAVIQASQAAALEASSRAESAGPAVQNGTPESS